VSTRKEGGQPIIQVVFYAQNNLFSMAALIQSVLGSGGGSDGYPSGTTGAFLIDLRN
jgi:hypothetical protein